MYSGGVFPGGAQLAPEAVSYTLPPAASRCATGWSPATSDPFPSTTSPGPILATVPSPTSISAVPDREIEYCRRGAQCQSST